MSGIFNKLKGGVTGATSSVQNAAGTVGDTAAKVGDIVPGTDMAAKATGIDKKKITMIIGLIVAIIVAYLIYAYTQKAWPFQENYENYYYENMRMYDNLGPGFGRRDPRDTSRAPLQEGFEIPAPVGNRQMDESLPSAVSVLNDPRFHTVTKTLLSTQNRIGENIQVRNPTTDLRGSVPVFTSGPGTLFNQQLSRSEFSDTLG